MLTAFSVVVEWSGVTLPSEVRTFSDISRRASKLTSSSLVATNAARDVGARLMVLTIWGLPAGGGSYAAIAALTNIPATLLAVLFYEYVLADSSRGPFPCIPSPLLIPGLTSHSPVITPAHVDFLNGHIAHQEHSQGVVHRPSPATTSLADEKGREQTIEHV